MIKNKLMIKAQSPEGEGYANFAKQIEVMLVEQGKFIDALEFKTAEAEALDKTQATQMYV